jgi:hypothetical protein
LPGLLDLGLTFAAQEAGGFLELNPLSSQLGHNTVLLTALKIRSGIRWPQSSDDPAAQYVMPEGVEGV